MDFLSKPKEEATKQLNTHTHEQSEDCFAKQANEEEEEIHAGRLFHGTALLRETKEEERRVVRKAAVLRGRVYGGEHSCAYKSGRGGVEAAVLVHVWADLEA